MMRILAALLIVGLFAGCAAAKRQSRTAESDHASEAHMHDRYDLVAISAFLRGVISEHPTFEGVSLTSTRLQDQWKRERIAPGNRMRSGDWVIYDVEQGDDRFDLYFMYDRAGGRCVTVQAQRLSKDHFQFLGLALDEWVELSDWRWRANQPVEPTSGTRIDNREPYRIFTLADSAAHG